MDNERLLLREPAKWLALIAARSHADGDCRIWDKGFQHAYGAFSAYGKPMRAHRANLTLDRGIALGDAQALHTCDRRACVAPEHLYAGTAQDNYDDAKRRNPHYRAAAQYDAIERLTRAGMGATAIAKELGVGERAVAIWRQRFGYAKPGPRKATPEMIAQAKRLRAQGLSYRAIGDALGAGTTSAHRWVMKGDANG